MDIYNDTEDVQLLNHNHDAEDEDEEEENMKHPNVAILNVEAAESTTSLNRPTASSRRKHNSYTSITVKRDGDHRFCKKCQLRKFDRAHHCRICKRCTLKMDHTTLPPAIKVSNGPLSIFGVDFNWIMLIFVSTIFGLFVIPFTLFHTRQLFKNRTTIEFYEKANYRLGRTRGRVDVMRSKYFNPWDLGARQDKTIERKKR
ncbi:palmitoyltransferase for Vac8p [Apophysomyces sp. BC1015]|nr:palmitoyltransferase for Vac8p [Apophysomyces sp. BC1015]